MKIAKDTTINLRDQCENNTFPECIPDREEDIEFGNGVGNDNIIGCSNYLGGEFEEAGK